MYNSDLCYNNILIEYNNIHIIEPVKTLLGSVRKIEITPSAYRPGVNRYNHVIPQDSFIRTVRNSVYDISLCARIRVHNSLLVLKTKRYYGLTVFFLHRTEFF